MQPLGDLPGALRSARKRLKLRQGEIAGRALVSTRTLMRWETGERAPDAASLRRLVTAILHYDGAAAEEIARAAGTSLVALGLARPDPSGGVIDAVVCAAAEAMDASPRLVRPALVATLKRMKSLGVSVDDALKELEPG